MKVAHQFQNITHGPLENNFLNQPRHVIWLTAESAEEHHALWLLSERSGIGRPCGDGIQSYMFSLPLNPTPEKKEFVGKELEPFREPIPGKPFPDNGTVNFDMPCPRCNSRIIFIYCRKTVMCAHCSFGESSHDLPEIAVARLRGKYLEGKREADRYSHRPLSELEKLKIHDDVIKKMELK